MGEKEIRLPGGNLRLVSMVEITPLGGDLTCWCRTTFV